MSRDPLREKTDRLIWVATLCKVQHLLNRCSRSLQERSMTQITVPKAWEKPQIKHLGELKDVAGAPSGTSQSASKS